MSSQFSLSYDRRRTDGGGTIGGRVGGGGGTGGGGAGRLPCRYYATERRRNRYSSFSIMKWFRRSKHFNGDGDDEDDSAWFRDDLQRIRQAYVEQEADYGAVTPIAARRRPTAAATWSRWTGSTTTVYSFAYVDGVQRDDDDDDGTERDGDLDKNDVVEYIDAATLPVAHRRRTDRGQPHPPSTAVGTSARSGGTAMTATKRRNKKVAPPPPVVPVEPSPAAIVIGTAKSLTVQRRPAGTLSRKKYRAPQPPAIGSEPRPQQQQPRGVCRRAAPAQRRKKGPAPKPPVVVQQQLQPAVSAAAVESEAGSNVRRKITQYEKDRLMQRVDKIERHFFDNSATVAVGRAKAEASGTRHRGFASPAALYTAMAATNLTELDKRAAEICRQRNRRGLDTVAAPLTADHKNAIVTAVIRKSYPTTTAATTVAAAADGKRPDRVSPASAADDGKRLVRHKRLAFFQQQRATEYAADKRPAVDGDSAPTASTTDVPKLLVQGTQGTASRSAAVASKSSKVDATPAADKAVRYGGGGCSSAAGTVLTRSLH